MEAPQSWGCGMHRRIPARIRFGLGRRVWGAKDLQIIWDCYISFLNSDRALGSNHPNTVTTRRNLEITRDEKG